MGIGGQGSAPRAAHQSASGGVLITTAAELEQAMRTGAATRSGATVTTETALSQAPVYGCVRIIVSANGTLPWHLMRRVDARTREHVDDHPLDQVLRVRPNRWQTPSQFKKMMTAHVLLRGNAYGLIVRNIRRDVVEIVPMDPDRTKVEQLDDLSLVYIYTRKNGTQVTLPQSEVMHLVNLSLDGVRGVTPLHYARETIGLSLAMEGHGASMFRNGAKVSGMLTHPEKLSKEALENLRDSLERFRNGGEEEGKALILEEGMEYKQVALTAEDAQWIESRKFSRTDIAMFFGVPPHMIGDTEKSTSWGSGIEQQSIGFVQYTLEDYLTMWEESCNRDLLPAGSGMYVKFNRAALVKGDIKTRWEAYVKGLQWGVMSPNEIRELEDRNPREGGDIYYPPPNTAGDKTTDEGGRNEPSTTA